MRKNKKDKSEEKKITPSKSEIPAQIKTGQINIFDLYPEDAEAIAHEKFMEDTLNGC